MKIEIAAVATAKEELELDEVVMTPIEAVVEIKRRLIGVGFLWDRKAWHACMRIDVDAEHRRYIEAIGAEMEDAVGGVMLKARSQYLEIYAGEIAAEEMSAKGAVG